MADTVEMLVDLLIHVRWPLTLMLAILVLKKEWDKRND